MIVIAIMAKANREASVRLPVSPPAVESARYPDLEVFSGTLVLDISAQATSESMATRRNILNPAWISSLPESALLRHRLCRLQRALKQILHRLIHARHLPFVKQSCCFYYSAFRAPAILVSACYAEAPQQGRHRQFVDKDRKNARPRPATTRPGNERFDTWSSRSRHFSVRPAGTGTLRSISGE